MTVNVFNMKLDEAMQLWISVGGWGCIMEVDNKNDKLLFGMKFNTESHFSNNNKLIKICYFLHLIYHVFPQQYTCQVTKNMTRE